MPREPVISTVLVCDDVREEITHKHILIGVYSGMIAVHAFPAQRPLAFWLAMKATDVGSFALTLRIITPKISPAAEMTLSFDIPAAGEPFALFTPPLPLPITEPGNLELHARWGDSGKWRVALRKPILLVPPSTQPTENNP
jgi:hypothetical protein